MLFNVNMNGTDIVSYDILVKAEIKGQELKAKYPEAIITVGWSNWHEGKSKSHYHTYEIKN
jgi:hypothetical protein